MNNTFDDEEKVYRAVFPESYLKMYWRKDGSVSSAAFKDPCGLSVERGYYRSDDIVIDEMRKYFQGSIISLTAKQCRDVQAVLLYKPSRRSIYHSELHGSKDKALLSDGQRKRLASLAKIEYYEK